ncbi:glutathione S-transferase family protein [Roseovarius sp. SCSIO 43702]|uniref:glutathione S-transferase family protein n=1 Tax=Roseovarius sp. SCSIO 43702 TaxID=2823043 RepID=UPI001C731DBF|nr:glutathione S-transferase family protein [Roseovarius sp. SCSIO 43702]QYX55794.1 glutathione S-transferase family protein [Roseovarius sp. SCSIO 43702]
MGKLVDGEWKDEWYDTESHGGAFKRDTSRFRNWITRDGAAGPSGEDGFPAASGRYHLYVSLACPWAHRTLIFRRLKDLVDHIGISVVHPDMLSEGWEFRTDYPCATGDRLNGRDYLREVYLAVDPGMSGRVTVPVLWDTERETIVSNESADIIRMMNSAFDDITGNTDDYYPEDLRAGIDEVNDRVYDTVNNGVYKAGFATSQEAYDKAVHPLFDSLDWLEERLDTRRYLMGDRLTEADWRLFTTLIRFDLVYHTHFKCNRARNMDYPALWGYTRDLYQHADIRETVNFDHIVRHYHVSQKTVNPHQIIPINPSPDFDAPHGRDKLGGAA